MSSVPTPRRRRTSAATPPRDGSGVSADAVVRRNSIIGISPALPLGERCGVGVGSLTNRHDGRTDMTGASPRADRNSQATGELVRVHATRLGPAPHRLPGCVNSGGLHALWP